MKSELRQLVNLQKEGTVKNLLHLLQREAGQLAHMMMRVADMLATGVSMLTCGALVENTRIRAICLSKIAPTFIKMHLPPVLQLDLFPTHPLKLYMRTTEQEHPCHHKNSMTSQHT
jgi:hypothetical protein